MVLEALKEFSWKFNHLLLLKLVPFVISPGAKIHRGRCNKVKLSEVVGKIKAGKWTENSKIRLEKRGSPIIKAINQPSNKE